MIDLIQQFESYVATLIDEEGIYPAPLFVQDAGGKLTIAALALEPDEAWMHFIQMCILDTTTEAIFGLDRTTRPDQGTEFADVLTCAYFRKDAGVEVNFKFGVINYQPEPRIVRAIDWNNFFWENILTRELLRTCKAARIPVPYMVVRPSGKPH